MKSLKKLKLEKQKLLFKLNQLNFKIKELKQYNNQTSTNNNIKPFKEFIDLKDLVGEKIFSSVLKNEKEIESHYFKIRGININFYTPNLRTLWQSAGQEYIEPELLNFIDSLSQDAVYFDVGASNGTFSIYSAIKGIKTICFEPEVTNFNILNLNSYLNHKLIKDNFYALNIAISDKIEINNINIKKLDGSAHEKFLDNKNYLIDKSNFSTDYKQSVITLTIDKFCHFFDIMPTDIKIDVDGSELAVVNGMINILSNSTLKRIFIEILDNEKSSMRALELLLDYGFVIHKKNQVQNYFGLYNYTLYRK